MSYSILLIGLVHENTTLYYELFYSFHWTDIAGLEAHMTTRYLFLSYSSLKASSSSRFNLSLRLRPVPI